MCACGKPLHYSDPFLQRMVQNLIDDLGENIQITVEGRTWLIPRHYLALHGLKAHEIPFLNFTEVKDAAI